jgi:hypothetical protein
MATETKLDAHPYWKRAVSPNLPSGTIVAHRWFDGTNTYHRVYIYADSGEVTMSEVTYGYGRAFEYTAREMLGLPEAGGLDTYGWHSHYVDVHRKRDL